MSHNRSWRRTLSALTALGMTAVLAACGSSSSAGSSSSGSAAAGDTTLNVLSWETYHDQAWLDEFTKSTGIKVNVVNVGSPDEMFAKVKSNPDQWDLALATSGWFSNYVKEDLIVPVDESKVKADIKLGFDWKAATSVDGKNYGVLYNWGDQPLAWLADSGYTGSPNDWSVLWDPQYKGKVSVFDDPTSVLPMIALAAGIKDPYHLDDAQFQQMSDKLMALRPQIKRLTSGFNDQTDQFATGEASIGYLNNIASVGAVAKKGKELKVSNTVTQGVPAWSDNYAITKSGAAKGDAVYTFINYTETLPWQARFVQSSGNNGTLTYEQATSADAVKAGLTKDALDATLIPATQQGDAFWKAMLFFQTVNDLDKRIALWNEFKLGIGS